MRKAIVILLLSFVSSSAAAAWEFLAGYKEDNGEISDYYVDPATASWSGNRAQIWALVDFANHEKEFCDKCSISMKFQWEFDCAGKRQHTLPPTQFYPEHMGRGQMQRPLPLEGKNDWNPTGGLSEDARKLVCETK